MNITVLLADAAQSDPSGKVHALGLGWTVIDAPTTQPMAVVVLVGFENRAEVADGPHEIVLRLLDADGSPFTPPDAHEPIAVRAALDMGPGPDEALDGPSTAPLVVSIGPGLPLEPSRRYRWEAEVDGRAEQAAGAAFVTRDAARG